VDVEDFLEPDELAAVSPGAVGVAGTARGSDADGLAFKESCDGCGVHISWVDTCLTCPDECTWCPECGEADGMMCRHCAAPLRRRPGRTQKVGR
jgi:hypothetical protein